MRTRAALRFLSVGKVYPGATTVRALTDVSFAAPFGSMSVVEGPSGSGKTTLLSLAGGLDRPTTGHILALDFDLVALSERRLAAFRRAEVGFVFQDFKLIDVLTAVENVTLALHLRGVSRREASTRSRDMLEALGMGDRMHARPAELSGGEKQRVAIARAFVSRPRLVLADEPTANLDGAAAADVLELLLAATRRSSTTVVVASHDARVSSRADQVVHVLDGKLVDSRPVGAVA